MTTIKFNFEINSLNSLPGKYSYKVYKLFEENYEPLVQEAEKYLESKKAANKSEA